MEYELLYGAICITIVAGAIGAGAYLSRTRRAGI